jgi:hypothetical protein
MKLTLGIFEQSWRSEPVMNKIVAMLLFGAVALSGFPSAFAQSGDGAGTVEERSPCTPEMEAAFRQADDVVIASPVAQPSQCEVDALGWVGCQLDVEISQVFKGRAHPGERLILGKNFRWELSDSLSLPVVDLSESWVLFLVRWSADGGESPLLQCTDCLRLQDPRASLPVVTDSLQACLSALRPRRP